MFSHMDFWTTFKIGDIMKLPIHIIEQMVKENPNDMILGEKVRFYINWLRNNRKEKDG